MILADPENTGLGKFVLLFMKKILLTLTIPLILITGLIFANQFLVMPWTSDDLSPLEKPFILIKKSERKLKLYEKGKLIKTYKIALGFEPVGDKETEGDGKTPEGDFYIFTKNSESKFYLSLGISYPNIEDAERGLQSELISTDEKDLITEAITKQEMPLQKTKLGGEIYIHGNGNLTDWTAGCIAMKNSDIKELYDVIAVKTPVRIEP